MIKTLLLLILSTKLAWSEMVSLKDYHAANPYLGKDEIYYVSNRCSALMYHLFSLQQTPTDLKEFLKNSQKEFTSLSLLINRFYCLSIHGSAWNDFELCGVLAVGRLVGCGGFFRSFKNNGGKDDGGEKYGSCYSETRD